MLGLRDRDFGVGFGFALSTTGAPKESKPDIGAKTKSSPRNRRGTNSGEPIW